MNLDLNCVNDYLRGTVRVIGNLDQRKLQEIADQLGKLQDNVGIL